MVNTASQMLPLGTPMPLFSLPDTTGTVRSSTEVADAKATLVVFMCNHCPFVKHIRGELASLGRDCAAQGISMVGINSNDIENYPDDSPARMKDEAEQYGYVFPYLMDEDQSVAKTFRAACTPDFFLFDADAKLIYRGQLDGSRPGNDVATDGADLRAAISAVLEGRKPAEAQTPSIGCNIKWKAGNAPAYFG